MGKQLNMIDPLADGTIYHGNLTLADDFGQLEQPGIVRREDGSIQAYGFVLTARGIDLSTAPSDQDAWQKLATFLFDFEGSIALCIGDMLVGFDIQHGVTYDQVAGYFGRARKSLYNYKYVCEKVQFSLRRENLSFGHYSVIAAYDSDSQDYWLEQASNQQWSVKQLSAAIKASQRLTQPTEFERRLHVVFKWKMDWMGKLSTLEEAERNKELRDIQRLRDELDSVLREFNWRRL
jgi:hypothetical protein